MKNLVPNISITVIREGKRVTPPLNKAYPFTADEVADVTKIAPNAFRKPVNETTEEVGEDATAPDQTAGATATKTPKQSAKKKKAAAKDSTSPAATAQDDQQSGEAQDTDDSNSGDDADDDDDI